MYSIRRWFGLLQAILAMLTLAACASGCAESDERPPLYSENANSGSQGVSEPANDRCVQVETGCPCTEPGKIVDCGQVKIKIDNYETCFEGSRLCGSDGTWGQCLPDQDLFAQ